ncbi:MAG: hypothetical protein JSU00_15550 [Acidobacteria bacterium]|nr:hypothetical protein [Acidobacteriota bacterium]
MTRTAAGIVVLFVLQASPPPVRSAGFQRGVNFTAEGPRGYTAEVARPMLLKLKEYGVNSVALVPYGFSRRDRPGVRFGGGWERDEGIESVARAARELGFKVLLKPQLWVHPGYPGDLEYPNAADRDVWFREYQAYIEHQAELAVRIHADVFSVGVELQKLTVFEQPWRRIIAAVRKIYPGPLTYGATQGPEFEGIRFWDALDYIGLNDYYPLPDDLNASGVAAKVEAIARKYSRPVLLTETGFSSYQAPHREPWSEAPRKLAPQDQARCYEAIYKAFYGKPWLAGIYWWKVGTNGYGGPDDGSHTPWGKPAMEVVRKYYRSGRR